MSLLEGIEILLVRLSTNEIGAQEFCKSFENYWNFEAEKKEIPAKALESLEFLFNEVVLFSPFPRDEWEYPKYRDADDILRAAVKALDSIRTLQKR